MDWSRWKKSAAASGSAALIALVAGCGFVSMAAKGTWEDSTGDVVLTFTQEGLITGTDGCNKVEGTWEEHGDDVTITMQVDEKNECPGVDVWLVNPTDAVIDGDVMQVYGPNDTHLGELTER